MQSLSAQQRHEVRALIALMKDPRYWRDQEPELVRMVHTGLRRIFRARTPAPAGQVSLGAIVPRRLQPAPSRANAG